MGIVRAFELVVHFVGSFKFRCAENGFCASFL